MFNRGRPGNRNDRRGMIVFHGLPDYLKILFIPDIKLESMATPEKQAPHPMTGLGHLLSEFDNIPETPVVVEKKEEAPKIDLKEQRRLEKMEQHKLELSEKIKEYNPDANPNATKNAMNTLFIGNLNYLTTEGRLRDLCEKYGPIENLILVKDHEGKSRGYAFIEYTYAEDMKSAYSHLNRYNLDNRQLIVDVERGRTVRKWLPARLGGGAGKTRITRPKKSKDKQVQPDAYNRNDYGRNHYSGRDDYRGRDGYRYRDNRRDDRRRDYGDDRRRDYGDDRRREYGDGRRRDYGDDRRRDYVERRRYFSDC